MLHFRCHSFFAYVLQAIKTNKAVMVTDHIAGRLFCVSLKPLCSAQSHYLHSNTTVDFTADSIVLQSGRLLPADVVVAATGSAFLHFFARIEM